MLSKLCIPRTTFYCWYDRYLQHGEAGLQDKSPQPKHVWNRVPSEVKCKVIELAFQETELSPRELAVTFTDQERYVMLYNQQLPQSALVSRMPLQAIKNRHTLRRALSRKQPY